MGDCCLLRKPEPFLVDYSNRYFEIPQQETNSVNSCRWRTASTNIWKVDIKYVKKNENHHTLWSLCDIFRAILPYVQWKVTISFYHLFLSFAQNPLTFRHAQVMIDFYFTPAQRYTYRVLQTIQMKLILLCFLGRCGRFGQP